MHRTKGVQDLFDQYNKRYWRGRLPRYEVLVTDKYTGGPPEIVKKCNNFSSGQRARGLGVPVLVRKAIMAEIMIDRSLDEVWSVITDVSSWKTWWGGDLKSVTPGWQVGAAVTWATGGGTTVFDFAEKKRIGLKGSYGEKVVWAFSQAPGGRTSVSMGEDLSSSGLVAASSAATQATHDRKLLQLKNCIESRSPAGAKVEPPTAVEETSSKSLPPGAAGEAQRLDLLEAVKSTDVGRRKEACYKSAALGGTEIVHALINALENDPGLQYNQREDLFQSSRKGAAFALGKLGDPSSAPTLVKALKNDFPWEAKSGKPVQRLDNPHRMDLGMPVFGTSVREGLKEADTEFARSVLAQVPPLPFSTAGEIGRALSTSASTKAAPTPVPKSPARKPVKTFWQFWRRE
jgi:hypothetical protein